MKEDFSGFPYFHRKTRPAGYTFAVSEEFELCQTAWGLKNVAHI